MLVQGPAPEVGRVQLKALQQSGPFLPQDEAGAGLILKPHRHCKAKVGGTEQKRQGLLWGSLRRMRNPCWGGDLDSLLQITQRGRLIAFHLGIPQYEIGFRAELNLETLHGCTRGMERPFQWTSGF